MFADEEEIATFQITAFEDPSRDMEKVGMNLYKVRDGAAPVIEDAFENGLVIQQGSIEKANVNVVTEMVKMIEVQRTFEANSKVMQTAHALDTEVISKVGRAK